MGTNSYLGEVGELIDSHLPCSKGIVLLNPGDGDDDVVDDDTNHDDDDDVVVDDADNDYLTRLAWKMSLLNSNSALLLYCFPVGHHNHGDNT